MKPWSMQTSGPGVLEVTWVGDDQWWLDPAAPAALAEDIEAALTDGIHRVEAQAPVTDRELRFTLQRAGMRPEGLARGRHQAPDGILVDVTRLARVIGDPPLGTRQAFLSMLNATLPMKRVIAQGLIRNDAGEVLMCELTYKKEWDLPGGVVDPLESPASALSREIYEEVGAQINPGGLIAVDWLPPYRQWDDAVLLVFDLGTHPDLSTTATLQPNEIAALHWCTPEDIEQHAAPYVVRLLAQIAGQSQTTGDQGQSGGSGASAYLEDGLPFRLDG